jgi:hypothetical protein
VKTQKIAHMAAVLNKSAHAFIILDLTIFDGHENLPGLIDPFAIIAEELSAILSAPVLT